jgi:hypothetical protein
VAPTVLGVVVVPFGGTAIPLMDKYKYRVVRIHVVTMESLVPVKIKFMF